MKNFNVGIKGIVKRKDGAVLLLKKSGSESFWEFPGGRIDDDETILQTLHRELGEEVQGIANICNEELVYAHRLQRDIAKDTSLVLLYYTVDADVPEDFEVSDEHSDFTWVKSMDDVETKEGTRQILELVLSAKQA